MIHILNYLMTGCAIVAFLIIIYETTFKESSGNFGTYALWCIYGFYTRHGVLLIGGDTTLLNIFILGSLIVAIMAIIKKKVYFGFFESVGFAWAFVLIPILIFGNAKIIIWLNSLGIFIVGMQCLITLAYRPLHVDVWTKTISILASLAATCSLVSILVQHKNPVSPSFLTALCFCFVWISFRKKWRIVH